MIEVIDQQSVPYTRGTSNPPKDGQANLQGGNAASDPSIHDTSTPENSSPAVNGSKVSDPPIGRLPKKEGAASESVATHDNAPGGEKGNALAVEESANDGDKASELSQNQKEQRYHERNDTIANGLKTFVDVGLALKDVHDRKLYKIEFATWEDYLEKKWDYRRSYASRLMRGAAVAREITAALPAGNIPPPVMEAQVRPLLRLMKDQRVGAWKKAHDAHPERPPTPIEIAEIVEEIKPRRKSGGKRRRVQGADESTQVGPVRKDADIGLDGLRNLFTEHFDGSLASTELQHEIEPLLIQFVTGLNRLTEKHTPEQIRAAMRDVIDVIEVMAHCVEHPDLQERLKDPGSGANNNGVDKTDQKETVESSTPSQA